jgi:excisionase family DNA binding protein
MITAPPLLDIEPAAAAVRLRRVQAHIDELQRTGRTADAEAVAFVRDLAEQVLAAARPRRTPGQRELLTTGDAGLALGISDQTVRNWVAAGRLPAVKRGVRTMIPREAILAEIERSRVRPDQSRQADGSSARAHDERLGSSGVPDGASAAQVASEALPASLTWRQALLAALPRETVERLDALHERLEDGQSLTADEQAEMIRLERQMADAAARHLHGVIRRGRGGARASSA